MYNVKDNIVALATTPGRSAINVVRVSGPSVKTLVESLFLKTKKKLKPNYCLVAELFCPATKSFLDQSIVSFFKGPKSFTGQDVVEISTHGGTVVVKKVIRVLCSLGCRNAQEGEFSYRAFINGKIDLIQAEAIANIINTNSDLDTLFSLENLSGSLSKRISLLCNKLKNIITYMEHELDFNEEEIDTLSFAEYSKKIKGLVREVDNVLNSSFFENQSGADLVVSILGRPNVGKSSLFNALLGHDRSIVTSVSGTTRDIVDAGLTIGGIQVSLVDTAGIRKTKNIIEEEGIKRAADKIKESDLILLVDDKNPLKAYANLNISNKNVVFVQNKIDVNKKVKDKGVFLVSCNKKIGLSKLFTYLSTYVDEHRLNFLKENSFILSDRVSALLRDFIQRLLEVEALLKKTSDLALIVSALYDSYDVFISTTHPSNKDEIINNIFKGFCVGK